MKNITLIRLYSTVNPEYKKVLEDDDLFLKEISQNEINFKSKDGITVFLIETGGTESNFKKIYQSYSEPYYLLTSGANNSLAASLEILSFLNLNGKKGKIIHGSNEFVHKELMDLDSITLEQVNFGVIGKPSDWLISSDVNYALALKKFGVNLIDITFAEFYKTIMSSSANLPSIFNNEILQAGKKNKEELDKTLQIYNALKTLCTKYKLSGLTVRCFDLLSTFKSTSCLALAILNSEGILAACEGDVPALLSMYVIKKAANLPAFQANPSRIDIEKQTIMLAHCSVPLNMCSSFSFDTHFESNSSIGIKGEMFEKDVTLFKLSSNLKDFIVLEGKITENGYFKNLCRTQINVKFDEDISSFFVSPKGNHVLICYGKVKEAILNLLLS
jgi:L-fucose isomerase-like protein